MREIKFRAWDKLHKVMGDNITIGGGIIRFSNGDLSDADDGSVELMQFTGLKDKNGKEIYEGDIVLFFNDKTPLAVEWIPGGFILNNKSAKASVHLNCNGDLTLQIIGNIHENHELLRN